MQEESQLISKVQQGDERAFALLYDKYSGALYNVILRMTRNEAQAQDLLQETFVSIWDKAKQYDSDRGRFYTWAYRIARHKVLNYLRSTKKLIQNEELGVYIDDTEEVDHGSSLKELKGALKQLETHHQKAIELVYFNGLTHQEAYKIMKVPLGTFKSYVQQAMRELRKHYKSMLFLLTLLIMMKG